MSENIKRSMPETKLREIARIYVIRAVVVVNEKIVSVKVITDSCSDLTAEMLERFNIDYAKMSTVYDGEEKPASLLWTPAEVHSFYEIMRGGNRIMTAQVSIEEFQRVFKEYLERGLDIIYIACSSKQSGSVNTGFVTANKLTEEYPGRKIVCIDSLNASMGEGMLAIEAAKLASGGAGIDEIAEHILKIRKTVNEYCTVHSLDALRRAGRVKGSAAFFGNLMGVKPIIIADANGEQAAYKKVKGRQRSFEEIVALLKQTIIEPEKQTLYLAHADCPTDEVEKLAAMLKEEIPSLGIELGYIGPIIGASIGPDAVAIFGFGEEVTFRA